MLYAHIFKVSATVARNTGHKFQIFITDSARPIGGVSIPCHGVRHGRKLAKENNAIPHNF